MTEEELGEGRVKQAVSVKGSVVHLGVGRAGAEVSRVALPVLLPDNFVGA